MRARVKKCKRQKENNKKRLKSEKSVYIKIIAKRIAKKAIARMAKNATKQAKRAVKSPKSH